MRLNSRRRCGGPDKETIKKRAKLSIDTESLKCNNELYSCYDTVIEWIGNGKMPTNGVVTNRFPLEQWEEGFHLAKTGEGGAMKVILIPNED